jgi:thiol-disulfide isomerase/thioredoxin
MMNGMTSRGRARRFWRLMFLAGVVLGLAAVAAVALYYVGAEFVTGRPDSRVIATGAPAENAGSASSDAFKFSFLDQPRAVPNLQFIDGDDRSLSLQDFRGRPILLNIWATWCIPCRKEMPALDRLQSTFDASELLVLPLSIDRQGAAVVKPFYRELSLKALGVYVDPSGRASGALNMVGVPTTLLIDREGREIGRKIGPAEWDSNEMIALLREHLGLPSNEQKGAAK